ncbi:MAG: EamA family transporter [Sporomusaceae bacterium]|nr:EamA family transporter [Sporomusaceae bacterium]
MKELSVILISIILGAAGQIGFKYGAVRIPETGTLISKAIAAWPIGLGLVLYGLSTILWIYMLRSVELSYAYPLLSLGYVLVFTASYFLFNEPIGVMRLSGLVLILAGIVLVAKS